MKSACKIDEKSIVSKYLNSIRKDYDKMNKTSQASLSMMNNKKKEIDVLKEKFRCQRGDAYNLE